MVKVIPVPCLEDNYAYLIVDEANKVAAAVDPVSPASVEAAAKEAGVEVTTILTTHNHWDHAGGNEEYAGIRSGIEIIGGVGDKAAAVTREVKHNDTVTVGDIKVTALYTPCHTAGHVCYFIEAEEKESDVPVVFTGDTLFSSGCGKFNAGTPEQMHHALNEILAKLPAETEVYNGHEYTLNNLAFALDVEPDNEHMKGKLDWATAMRKAGKTTLPSTIENELLTNPFMRVDCDAAKAYTKKTDPVEVIAELRRLKNSFRR